MQYLLRNAFDQQPTVGDPECSNAVLLIMLITRSWRGDDSPFIILIME